MLLPLLLALIAPDESWLLGDWAPRQSSCGSDAGIRFETDGTYSELDGEGVWSLAGDQLTVRSTGGDDFGRQEVARVSVRSPGEMELEWTDGARARFRRCPQGD